ncbi:hypothetical protein [Streptomyces laurentii]|uniref:hypothetical protein n=1 Tax=Streptomyces laurentii TaxID=39478 RepID=UPI0033C9981D
MSASEQDTQDTRRPDTEETPETADTPKAAGTPEAVDAREPVQVGESAHAREPADVGEPADAGEVVTDGEAVDERTGLTPRQARLARIAAGSVVLVAMAVVLVVRLAAHTSVLVVGVYGLAMILCGIVIELSRNGRTRLATYLLAGGLAATLAMDWLLP